MDSFQWCPVPKQAPIRFFAEDLKAVCEETLGIWSKGLVLDSRGVQTFYTNHFEHYYIVAIDQHLAKTGVKLCLNTIFKRMKKHKGLPEIDVKGIMQEQNFRERLDKFISIRDEIVQEILECWGQDYTGDAYKMEIGENEKSKIFAKISNSFRMYAPVPRLFALAAAL